MRKKILTFIFAICLIIPCMIMLTACDLTSPDIEFKVENGYIQYYDGEFWKDLIAIEDLEGKDGVAVDGREVEFQKTSTHIQWRYKTSNNSDTWKNLFALTDIEGEDGTDGREVEIRKTATHIQWRYADNNQGAEDNWTNLVALSELKGEKTEVSIGNDGYWYIDGVKTEFMAVAKQNYTITYDYGFTIDEGVDFSFEDIFDNYKLTEEIGTTQWLINLPCLKNNVQEKFDGWYIKDTNKKIENYDFIGGDVILVAKWSRLPSGLYLDNTYIKTWEDFRNEFSVVFKNDQMISHNTYPLRSIKSDCLVIDNSITQIGRETFFQCKFEQIVLSENITTIGDRAFFNCVNLSNISLPASVVKIENSSFANCFYLKNISVDKSNKKYNSNNNCNAIVETASNTLIQGCANTIITNDVYRIADEAFAGCKLLTDLYIPESVIELNAQAFSGCDSLQTIVVNSNNKVYDSRDNCNAIIETQTNTLVLGCVNTNLVESIEIIGAYAFYGQTQLKSLTIHEYITEIQSYAFGNINLDYIVIDSAYISNSIKAGGCTDVCRANKIYIKLTLNISDSTYLQEKYTEQTSDMNFYKMFVKI